MNQSDRETLNDLLDRVIIRIKGNMITEEDYPDIHQKLLIIMAYLMK